MCDIHLLDGNKLALSVAADASVRDIFDQVGVRLKLGSSAGCFGLATVVHNEEIFLPMNDPVAEYMPERAAVVLVLYFGVEFYTEPPEGAAAALYWFFRQVFSDVLTGRVVTTDADRVVLGGLALQALLGDRDAGKHGDGYFAPEDFLPAGAGGNLGDALAGNTTPLTHRPPTSILVYFWPL